MKKIRKLIIEIIGSILKSVTQASRSLIQVHISEPLCQMGKSKIEVLKHKLEFSQKKEWRVPCAKNTFASHLY